VILWKDFILDDFIGPSLIEDTATTVVVSIGGAQAQSRSERSSQSRRIMDEAVATKVAGKDSTQVQLQETGQDPLPARMVGVVSTDSSRSLSPRMDARVEIDGTDAASRQEKAVSV
jgi:hypothetical protein